jgi:hypothetical protein
LVISIDGDEDEEFPPQDQTHHDGGVLVTVISELPVSLTLTHHVVVPMTLAIFVIVLVMFARLQLYHVLIPIHNVPTTRLHHGAIASVTVTPVKRSCPLFVTVIIY